MANEVVKKPTYELDGFSDFTSEVEGEENVNVSSQVIQGIKINFLDPRWLQDGTDITGRLLTMIGLIKVKTKWGHNNKPLETRILAPNEKFPNFKELNDKCDRNEWREKFGELVGPWAGQHCVYFIDEHLNRYTWPSPLKTIGSRMCVCELIEQVKLVHKFKGSNAYPVCELGHIDFPTRKWGLKQRPYLLNIREWVALGPNQKGGALPAPDRKPEIADATKGAPAGAQSVKPPTLAEELGDEIQF